MLTRSDFWMLKTNTSWATIRPSKGFLISKRFGVEIALRLSFEDAVIKIFCIRTSCFMSKLLHGIL